MMRVSIYYSVLFVIGCLFIVSCENSEREHPVTEGVISGENDVELFYQVTGSAPDTLVMLHGGPGLNFEYLAPDLTPLENHFTLIYYDQRGAGRSTLVSDPQSLTVDDHIGDLEAVRNYFELDQLSLFGHSWGGLLAAYYALEYPDFVSSKVLSSPSSARDQPYSDMFMSNIMEWMDSDQQDQAFELMDALMDENTDAVEACEAFWELFLPGYFADPFDRETIDRMEGDFCSGSEESLRNGVLIPNYTMASIEDYDIREDLESVETPVLIITGREDIFPVEAMEEWESAYPNARLVLLDQAGHYPQVEKPDEYFQELMNFLR